MSLRPIDLQVMLNQMSEVGRKEKKRQDKRTEEKQDKDDLMRSKQEGNQISIGDVDKVEISGQSTKAIPKMKGKKKERENKEEEEGKVSSPESKLKGNFLDIKE